MPKKRICIFSPNLGGGGAERVISIITNCFSNDNYYVDLILADATGPYLKDINSVVNIINFKQKKVIQALPQLISYLKKNKPEIIFTSHMHASATAIWAVKLARVSTHTVIRQPTMLKPKLNKDTLTSSIKFKVILATLKSADQIIVTSNTMYEEFIHLCKIKKDKVKIIHNPFDIKNIKSKSVEPLEHPWFSDNIDLPVILSVGRLTEVKDFQTLLLAMKEVNKFRSTRLIILGEGPLRNDLQNLINKLNLNELVDMPGFKSNPYSYMKNADVYVLSSLWEGFPNSLVEAMACGTSVVSTNCEGGAAEILDYGKFGSLVPVKDPKALSEAIINALKGMDSSEIAQQLQYVQSFSIDYIFEEYKQTFDAL